MIRKYKNLCKPITIGNVTFRNRMFSAPMSGAEITPECTIGPKSTAFYELRAKGGAAVVTVSELMVHPPTDASHAYHLNTQTVGSVASFTYTADTIKRHGAVPSVEFSHSGQYAGTYLLDKNKKESMTQYGPSEGTRPDGLPVTPLTREQIKEIVQAYYENAKLAKLCGFEMIMVHGGHGWLINQFLSPYFNHRTDEYGGSLENRVRLAREVLTAVREAVGPGFPIEFRMSGSELFDGGYDLEEGVRIAQAVEDLVDLIHVSAGSYKFGFSVTHPSMFREHGCNVYLAEEIKKHVSKPVATIGGLNDPAMMDELIGSGKVDVVVMGRALLADPELPGKVMENREDEIVRCLRCFVCMAERGTTQTRRCSVNPLIGREWETMGEVPLARKQKKGLVIGGGVAGLEAALTAARRGHRVVLCEKSDRPGGILKCEEAIDFKREMYELGITLDHLARKEGVEIRLGTEVTLEYAQKEQADAAIIAVGSEPIVPPLPGMNGEHVVVVNNYYLEKEKVKGEEVVVLGGGLAGCECAIHLARDGKKVHLVEMRGELAPDANIRHRPILLKELEDRNVACHLNHQGLRIEAEGVYCKVGEEEVLVPGTSVICAVGQRARRDVAESLLDCAPVVKRIGDCVRPANICMAVYQGYHAAMDI